MRLFFKGRSPKDVEQQRREFNWILHNIKEAKSSAQEEKWKDKMSRWLRVHEDVRNQLDQHLEQKIKEMLLNDPNMVYKMRHDSLEGGVTAMLNALIKEDADREYLKELQEEMEEVTERIQDR